MSPAKVYVGAALCLFVCVILVAVFRPEIYGDLSGGSPVRVAVNGAYESQSEGHHSGNGDGPKAPIDMNPPKIEKEGNYSQTGRISRTVSFGITYRALQPGEYVEIEFSRGEAFTPNELMRPIGTIPRPEGPLEADFQRPNAAFELSSPKQGWIRCRLRAGDSSGPWSVPKPFWPVD